MGDGEGGRGRGAVWECRSITSGRPQTHKPGLHLTNTAIGRVLLHDTTPKQSGAEEGVTPELTAPAAKRLTGPDGTHNAFSGFPLQCRSVPGQTGTNCCCCFVLYFLYVVYCRVGLLCHESEGRLVLTMFCYDF